MELYKTILVLTLLILASDKFRNRIELPFFNIFIAVSVLFEIPLSYLSISYFGSNFIVYNIFPSICVGFYFFTYYNIISSNKIRRWILIMGLSWLAYTFGWFIYNDIWTDLNNISYVIGMFLVLLLITAYFYQVLDNNDFSMEWSPEFYLSLGILFFFTSSFAILCFAQELFGNSNADGRFSFILRIGNTFLSLGYLGAAICLKRSA